MNIMYRYIRRTLRFIFASSDPKPGFTAITKEQINEAFLDFRTYLDQIKSQPKLLSVKMSRKNCPELFAKIETRINLRFPRDLKIVIEISGEITLYMNKSLYNASNLPVTRPYPIAQQLAELEKSFEQCSLYKNHQLKNQKRPTSKVPHIICNGPVGSLNKFKIQPK